MTKAHFVSDPLLPHIEVNGRRVYVRRVTEFRQIKPGRFEGVASGTRFEIEGGRQAGGSSRDWFLDWAPIGGTLYCTSLVDAIKQIERA